ncbi:MAG TPA: four helix bundle protein [Planctomycetota bacterium]|nr:four helix bundle protein [Planctomycetota bacterium]
MRIARRSATELQSHLYVALDQKLLPQPSFDRLYESAAGVKRLIGGFIRYLESGSKPRK